jgi:hypothetical protein
VLVTADASASDFSGLVAHWANGVEIHLPAAVAERPLAVLGLIANVLSALAPETVDLSVALVPPGATTPRPTAPFIFVSNEPPSGSTPRVRFDKGQVVVTDRAGNSLLDLGGFSGGAVAQVVNASGKPGLWLKALAADGILPAPAEVRLDRGDVAFIDTTGVALALSTERDTLLRVSYPEQVSWVTVAGRFRTWIIGSLWVLASIGFLFGLQRVLRRRPLKAGD